MFIQIYRHTDRPPRAKSKHARFYLAGKKPVHVQDVTHNTIAYDKIFRNIEFSKSTSIFIKHRFVVSKVAKYA